MNQYLICWQPLLLASAAIAERPRPQGADCGTGLSGSRRATRVGGNRKKGRFLCGPGINRERGGLVTGRGRQGDRRKDFLESRQAWSSSHCASRSDGRHGEPGQ